MTPNVRVATFLRTSPVTGIANDVAAIAAAIRATAPDAYIFIDGIRHASHVHIDIAAYDIDGYVISPHKVFSHHGYGIAWVSDQMTALPLEQLFDGRRSAWEVGTRDTRAYATFSYVVRYLDWLGAQHSDNTDCRTRIEAAGAAIHAHERP